MTPVAKTGLHCGGQARLVRRVDAWSDPGREDRAPLRLGSCSGCAHAAHVTPVAKTGLHCGDHQRQLAVLAGEVTPVAKTGLHCGGQTPGRCERRGG